MKLKSNMFSLMLLQLLHKYIDLYIKFLYHRSCSGQKRSKLLDFATIYPSGPMVEILGRQQ